jgi:hypothetical protein
MLKILLSYLKQCLKSFSVLFYNVWNPSLLSSTKFKILLSSLLKCLKSSPILSFVACLKNHPEWRKIKNFWKGLALYNHQSIFRSTTYQCINIMYKYKTSIFPFAGLIESKMRLSECEGGGGYVWSCTECSYTSKRRNVPVLIIFMADD